MAKRVLLLMGVVALLVGVTVAQEMKFANMKECMMCLKMNRGKAMEAADAGDMTAFAAATGKIKSASMWMKKSACGSDKMAKGCEMQMKAIAMMEKAKDKDAAAEAVKCLKNACMSCHKMCKG